MTHAPQHVSPGCTLTAGFHLGGAGSLADAWLIARLVFPSGHRPPMGAFLAQQILPYVWPAAHRIACCGRLPPPIFALPPIALPATRWVYTSKKKTRCFGVTCLRFHFFRIFDGACTTCFQLKHVGDCTTMDPTSSGGVHTTSPDVCKTNLLASTLGRHQGEVTVAQGPEGPYGHKGAKVPKGLKGLHYGVTLPFYCLTRGTPARKPNFRHSRPFLRVAGRCGCISVYTFCGAPLA